MPKISKDKINKISEQIISFLYFCFPRSLFTSEISLELARDEEFVKSLLLDLEKKGLLIKVLKNFQGKNYSRRVRWRISNDVYRVYKEKQKTLTKEVQSKTSENE
jgi:predicted transcriptional regulator with HTH domain